MSVTSVEPKQFFSELSIVSMPKQWPISANFFPIDLNFSHQPGCQPALIALLNQDLKS